MKKALIAIIGLVILIVGCTQSSSDSSAITEELGELPDLTVSGMKELGDLPSVNQTVDIGGGTISSNPFPDQPQI